MKTNILAAVFSCILSLFLAVVLLAGSLCVYAQRTVCEPGVLLQVSQECGYSQELYDEIKYKWENLLSITGVMKPEPILEVLTPELVQEDTLVYLHSAYMGASVLDTDELKSHLESKIRDYAYSNNIHATPKEELEQNITDLVNACIQDYQGSITIPLLPRILGAVSGITGYLKIGLYAVSAVGLVLLIFLFFLQRKRRNTLYYTAIATATDAVLLLGLTALADRYELIARLPFEASALKTLISAYLQTLLNKLNTVGSLFLWVTVALLLVYALTCTISALLRSKKVPDQNNTIG